MLAEAWVDGLRKDVDELRTMLHCIKAICIERGFRIDIETARTLVKMIDDALPPEKP